MLRKALPIALLVFAIVAIAITASGLGVRQGVGCAACHREHAVAHSGSMHQGVTCEQCHASPGMTGIVADGLRSVRWVAVMPFRGARSTFAPERPCRECHQDALTTVVIGAVAVRHEDFSAERCSRCHGGTGHRLDERWYTGPLMDDCTTCHRVSGTNPASCKTCHTEGAARRQRTEGLSVFQASHGPGWERAHGMGDLTNCQSCHAPSKCARCHVVPIPHQRGWQRIHGKGMPPEVRPTCETCHTAQWCTDCHGAEMPHPSGFMLAHGDLIEEDAQACYKCHSQNICAECHYRARHEQAPGAEYHSGLGEPQ